VPTPAETPGTDSLDQVVVGLLGLARGVLADGVVNEAEARALQDWVQWHPDAMARWPVSILARRLERIFRDGLVDPEERADLAELLRRILEGTPGPPMRVHPTAELPLDPVAPVVTFQGRNFVFMGRFASGSAASRTRRVVALGGTVEPEVTSRTDMVVVGAFTGEDAVEGPVAEGLARAVGLRAGSGRPSIIGEEHWIASLPRDFSPEP
jgi:hypothetical protein